MQATDARYTNKIMYNPEQITFFAKTDGRGQQTPFGIKADDRTRHVYVIGKTGMGKSTLLENMAVQDIKNGNGIAFIDPHGQTAETLLDYIPEERKNDVVYFAPFDTENPVSFNVMEDVGPDKRHLVVSGLMSVFKKVFVDAWSARMEYILSNTLMALLEYPDSTLLGVNRMLSDKDYRMRVIENITDPAVKSFWVDEFLKYNERYMQEAGDAIKNKIGQFTGNPLIRNIIGQPHSSFDIREIMDQKKILIMNLSKGLVGESNANLLGSMLTTRIYLAAMSRANLNAEQMKETPNFYFYVDEFQSFANATFADILSEARKYKLNLTIAHQYIEQMEEEVRNAVFGNVGTIISFRVGPFDAEVLETIYTPKFLAPDIVNLGFAQIYLTLMIDGIGSQPFSAVTLPPIELSGASCKDIVIGRSRELYSKKRLPVEEVINAWHSKSFSNKPPYVPKHLREEADGGTLPNTGANLKKNDTKTKSTNDAKKTDARSEYKTPTRASTSTSTQKPVSAQASAPKSEPSATRTDDRHGSRSDSSHTRSNNYTKNTNDDRPIKKEHNKDKDTRNNKDIRAERGTVSDDTPKRSENNRLSTKDNSPTPVKQSSQEKSTKNLDDLREVLKNISSEADTSKKTNNKPSEKERSGSDKNDSSLKDVVASALSKPIESEVKKETYEVPEKKVLEKELSKPASTDDQREYAQMKNIDDPLSVKKLERMMRTNTSDKPPIK